MGTVKEMVEKQKQRLRVTAHEAIAELVDEVLHSAMAPVDTGAFLANMNASINSPDASFNPNKTDKDGMPTALRIRQVIDILEIGDKFYLCNGAPYGPLIEYGLYRNPPKRPTGKTIGGYSSQAPAGVFRVSVAKWKDIVFRVVANNMNGAEAIASNTPRLASGAAFMGTGGAPERAHMKAYYARDEFARWAKRNKK